MTTRPSLAPRVGVALTRGLLALAFILSLAGVSPVASADHHEMNPCNPCAGKNPCNPCAGKNPCNPCAGKNPCNPCAGKNPCNPCAGKNPCNPCAGKNPCNPCGASNVDPDRFKRPAGVSLASADPEALRTEGERLWKDRSLGTSGLACATCHTNRYGQMNATFAKPYPHYVAMPHQQAGVAEVDAAEMVNFCMIVPMQDDPLAWSSRELAALTAYVESIQPGFSATQ